jgi:hypothetical protein
VLKGTQRFGKVRPLSRRRISASVVQEPKQKGQPAAELAALETGPLTGYASAQTHKDYKEFGEAAPNMLMGLYDLVLPGGAGAFQEVCKDTFKGKLTGAEIPSSGGYGGRIAFQCKTRSIAGPITVGVAFFGAVELRRQVEAVSISKKKRR